MKHPVALILKQPSTLSARTRDRPEVLRFGGVFRRRRGGVVHVSYRGRGISAPGTVLSQAPNVIQASAMYPSCMISMQSAVAVGSSFGSHARCVRHIRL